VNGLRRSARGYYSNDAQPIPGLAAAWITGRITLFKETCPRSGTIPKTSSPSPWGCSSAADLYLL
tara:strand:+ start:2453 stop:2647 length:195 start_codon:yes stop_codon:yes gene_type:complete